MSYQKIADLVTKIYKKSNDGTIEWEATEKEGTYQLSFSNYSVRIFTKENKNIYDNNQYEDDYILQILNDEGELVEETNDGQLSQLLGEKSFEIMKHLYEIARRQVMGVENALDSILNELIDEDDIPF